MKTRPSKAYLVIGSAHLGMDDDILAMFGKVAWSAEAEVVHIGPITQDMVVKRYHRTVGRKDQTAVLEARSMMLGEQETIERLVEAFGHITFVANSGQYLIQPEGDDITFVKDVMEFGKHLSASAVSPTGDRVTAMPISKKSRNYYKNKGASWILPHPTPAIESFPREGLNQAHNFYTTGSLKLPDIPQHSTDMYQSFNLPCATLIIVDSDNGDFHARPLHVDYVRSDISHRIEPCVIDDGLVYMKGEIIEVGSEDRACGSWDDHNPYQHMGVLAATRAQNELHEPSIFVNGGDASDMEPVSRHTKDQPLSREGLRLKDAIDGLRWLLDAQINVKSIKHKVILDSNHHEWLSIYISENPCLKGLLDWATLAKEKFADWDMYLRQAGADKTWKFGDLSGRHGDKEQPPTAWEIFGKYVGGHYHRYRVIGRAFSLGPGCRLGPKYLQNSVTAWQNMIVSMTKYKGKAAVAPKIVLHDETRQRSRFCYRGTIYEIPYFE